MRHTLTARFAMHYRNVRFSPMPMQSSIARRVAVDSGWRLAARDGINHQDLVMLTRNLFDAFTGRHVKWLRASLRFIFRNYIVYLFHVSGCRIVFKKRLITVG